MENNYPWVFISSDNNMWKVYLNSSSELMYKIIYENGKWTEEKLIDTNVVEFSICVQDQTIHIVYANKKYELRYCTRKDEKWFGEKICDIQKNNFEIQTLKALISQDKMHLFYLLKSKGGSKRGILRHCIWDGKKVKQYNIQYIVLSDRIKTYYQVYAEEKNLIKIFFASNNKDELSLGYSEYKDGLWTDSKRLYGIHGSNVTFKVLKTHYTINIINKMKENFTYSLEHVCIEEDTMNMKSYKIYEGKEEPVEPIIFSVDGILFTSWLKENNVFCSKYNLDKWETPIEINKDLKEPINAYVFLNNKKLNDAYIVYGIENTSLKIISFKEISKNTVKALSKEKSDMSNYDEYVEKLKQKSKNIYYENNILKEKIDFLNKEIKEKKLSINEYENRLIKIGGEKKILKENYDFFIQVKKNIQKELENTKEQLENYKLFINKLQNSLDKKEKNNNRLKQEITYLMNENLKVKQELKLEKNKSIVDKLFKKKE
ncbi:hypothetical protein [Clostridium sp. AWRP]|uniref:coiled-coil domain-containing protein n=1 Tax=Clostridium sp. AWRP TaxID=2212991 RepID=UPI000FD91951|nr:hypothetical protein [Clostridium sp. AWRP]AZV56838.1 hypothetical protein DMR38_09650 [Clostridium sp. AWRP]